MTIFIIDGSKVGWHRIGKLLERVPNVQLLGGAADASTSLESILLMKPDVVILDIDLPGRKGIVFLRQVLQQQPTLKIIVLTNSSTQYYRKQCLKAGAILFFDKSTEFSNVLKAIEQLTDNHSHEFLNTPNTQKENIS